MVDYDQLHEVVDVWADKISKLLADSIAIGAALALEDYCSTQKVEDFVEWIQKLDPELILEITNDYLLEVNDVVEWLEQPFEAAELEHILRDEDFLQEVLEMVALCNQEDSDWENALTGLNFAYNDVLMAYEEENSSSKYFYLGFAAGTTAFRLASGDWIGGGVGAIKVVDQLTQLGEGDAAFERILVRWDLEVERFQWSTFHWRYQAEIRMYQFLIHMLTRITYDDQEGCDFLQFTLEHMIDELTTLSEEVAAKKVTDFTVGIENNSCPRCFTQYSPEIEYCDICEVGL